MSHIEIFDQIDQVQEFEDAENKFCNLIDRTQNLLDDLEFLVFETNEEKDEISVNEYLETLS